MSYRSKYNHVANTATEPKNSWTNLEVAQFHYFNPNGLVQAKRKLDDQIADLVDAGIVPSGWHLAYGTMSDFEVNQIIDLTHKKRVGRISLFVAIKMLTEQNEMVAAKIIEKQA